MMQYPTKRFLGGYRLAGFLLLGLPIPTLAQQPAAQPALEQVLTRVQGNFDAYLSTVPNLFADEHLISSRFRGGPTNSSGANGMYAPESSNANITTDSIFRLKHSDAGSRPVTLTEARQIQSVDHRPPVPDQALNLPDIITGAFSYAGSFLSPALEPCYDYHLQHSQRLHGATVLVIDYALKHLLPRDVKCPIVEQTSGRAYIDPATMQIVRLEQKRPHHEISPELLDSLNQDFGVIGQSEQKITLNWSWSIDYAPVSINNKSFWLPKTITSTESTTAGRLINWSFVANYSNYHLMGVHSTILPGYTTIPEQ